MGYLKNNSPTGAKDLILYDVCQRFLNENYVGGSFGRVETRNLNLNLRRISLLFLLKSYHSLCKHIPIYGFLMLCILPITKYM